MGVAQKQKLNSLCAVIENELVVVNHVGDLQRAFADVLAATGRLPDLELVPPVEKGRRGAVAHTPSEPEARKVRIQR